MQKPSDDTQSWEAQREKIIGLGERSLRKTYYPELQQKLDELERFRTLLDQSNDCIFLLQYPSLMLADVNQTICRTLGYTRQELLSLALEQFLASEAAARIRELLDVGLEQGWDRDTITTQLYRRSGEGIPIEINIRAVSFNKIMYGVAVARDITERLLAEKIHLENTRMLRDMELARQIQLSLLPNAPPAIPGIELSGCCVPATHVGGDYYDYYCRDGGVVDMVVADVSGHSIGAALMMVEARSALRTAVCSSSSTGDILCSLNESLFEDLNQAELFITLFYVQYDTVAKILTYSNGGHVMPILFRGCEGRCCELDAEGLLLGVARGVTFEEKKVRLLSGDVLLMYTDGVTECQNSSGDFFGRSRLCQLLRVRHRESPKEIVSAVLEEVSKFADATAVEDDVTMMVMKVL